MTVLTLIALAVLAGGVGLLVGAVGIGGVVLVPLLNLVLAVDVRIAIASCLFSYLFSGLVSVHLYRRFGSIEWRSAGVTTVGAVPGAFIGAATVDAVSARGLLLLIAFLMLAAGAHALFGPRGADRTLAGTPAGVLISLGFGVGFVSALTGTGGAVTVVPLLLAFGITPLAAIGLGQVMQLPVALFGSVRNLAAGTIDFELAGILALGLSMGVAAGARLAHRLPTKILRRLVSILLIGLGGALALRICAT